MLNPQQVALVMLGAGVLVAGLYTLWGRSLGESRVGRGTELDDPKTDGAGAGGRRGLNLTEPTRLSVGVVLLVLGYHLVVWGVPALSRSAFMVPMERWWLVVIGCGLWIGATLGLDRLEAR